VNLVGPLTATLNIAPGAPVATLVELGTDFIVMPREVLRDIVEGGQPGFEAIGQVRKFLMKIDADVKKASKEAKRVAHPH
jgi:hypothetical protein